jgi:hypothetical protein
LPARVESLCSLDRVARIDTSRAPALLPPAFSRVALVLSLHARPSNFYACHPPPASPYAQRPTPPHLGLISRGPFLTALRDSARTFCAGVGAYTRVGRSFCADVREITRPSISRHRPIKYVAAAIVINDCFMPNARLAECIFVYCLIEKYRRLNDMNRHWTGAAGDFFE